MYVIRAYIVNSVAVVAKLPRDRDRGSSAWADDSELNVACGCSIIIRRFWLSVSAAAGTSI